MLSQTSIFAGTSNAGTSPMLNFGATGVDESNLNAVLDSVRNRAHFVTSPGVAIPAKVDAAPSKTPDSTFGYIVGVSPISALDPDTWDWLVIVAGDSPVMWDAGNNQRVKSTDGSLTIPFFTGMRRRLMAWPARMPLWCLRLQSRSASPSGSETWLPG